MCNVLYLKSYGSLILPSILFVYDFIKLTEIYWNFCKWRANNVISTSKNAAKKASSSDTVGNYEHLILYPEQDV